MDKKQKKAAKLLIAYKNLETQNLTLLRPLSMENCEVAVMALFMAIGPDRPRLIEAYDEYDDCVGSWTFRQKEENSAADAEVQQE